MLNTNITIVIPCKNESINIYDCLGILSKQKYIQNTKVIIADSSDQDDSLYWLERAKEDFSHKLNINVIQGGYPAKARFEGSKLVDTKYVLFLDSDIMITNDRTIINCFETALYEECDLLTIPFKTEKGWNFAYRIFDFFQLLGVLLKSPFAVGGFQLWKTKAYWETGGYVESHLFAEDYWVSSKCDSKKFVVSRDIKAWTSARRFKNKGVFYMINLLLQSYINRKNEDFFKQHHNYWA